MEENKKRKTSIALLAVLGGITYLYLIGIDLVNNWDSHANSFIQGYNAGSRQRTNLLSNETFSLLLNAKNIDNYYSDSLMNLKSNRVMPAKYQLVDVEYQFKDHTEYRQMFKYRVAIGAILFVLLFLIVLVPVLFYATMAAFYKNHIFNNDNVKRLNILGISLLIIYGLQLIFDITIFLYKKQLIEIENYSLSIHLSGAEWLFMGFITLLIANILKRSVELKEEQELTI